MPVMYQMTYMGQPEVFIYAKDGVQHFEDHLKYLISDRYEIADTKHAIFLYELDTPIGFQYYVPHLQYISAITYNLSL